MSQSVGGPRRCSIPLIATIFGLVVSLIAGSAPADYPTADIEKTPKADAAVVTDSAEDAPFGGAKTEAEVQPEADAQPEAAAVEQPKAAKVERPSLGDPLASGMVALLKEEILNGLKRRNIVPNFARFRAYSRHKLDSTAGDRRTSEVTGNCRLNWYDHLMRNPLKAAPEAEQFTRELHKAVVGGHKGLDQAMVIAGGKLDLKTAPSDRLDSVENPEQALEAVRKALTRAQVAYAAALAPLTGGEVGRLRRSLYQTLTRNGSVGHTLSDRGSGRYVCDLLEKVDRKEWLTAARALVPLADPELLGQLAELPDDEKTTVEGVTGEVVRRISTPSGDIVIGGRQENTYQLDAMPGVAVVIDLGGDDVYYEGTCSLERPVLVVIDLDGNDRYRAKQPGVQGAAVLGVSMLLDRAGDDRYLAKDVAQGSCLGGAGILIDYAGDDSYIGVRRVQGQAIGGIGMLVDHAGNDRYRGAMWTQGFGGPLGLGMLDDMLGNDHFYTGGLYYDSYEETPGYEGWGQGVGSGIRQVADGGIGVILDGGGDDVYEYDYLSHGGGYWLGLGFARDFAGNDQRLGATREAFNGTARTERRFVRFSNGFGCHYAAGFLFDDAGDDTYNGTIMSVGFAWDVAIGVLCDFGGKDQYAGAEGNGAQAGLGILYDYQGNDVYRGYRQGRASAGISYHDLPYCGGNFSFVIDYGGTDRYGCGAQNNSYLMRSSSGGFLIDRPKKEEIEKTQTAVKESQTARSGS